MKINERKKKLNNFINILNNMKKMTTKKNEIYIKKKRKEGKKN
jgi:hypothetical protein